MGLLVSLASNLLPFVGMIRNSFLQKVILTIFWGVCAAGAIQFYKHIVWRANEDISDGPTLAELYGGKRAKRGSGY